MIELSKCSVQSVRVTDERRMGEGEPRADLGPPTIKIFISGNSGSKEVIL